jgi:hypothetical protein
VVQAGSPGAAASTEGPRTGRSLGWLRWVGLGLGLAAVGAGAGLLAIDGRPTCNGPAGVNCAQHWNTSLPGSLLLATGGALAITAALALVLRWGLGPRVVIAPRPGGAMLSLGSRF